MERCRSSTAYFENGSVVYQETLSFQGIQMGKKLCVINENTETSRNISVDKTLGQMNLIVVILRRFLSFNFEIILPLIH